jgi:hypothetical protein
MKPRQKTQEEELKSSVSTSQTLFSPYPDCVRALASYTGMNPKELKIYYDAHDGRYERLEKLKRYIQNYSDIRVSDPANRLNKKEVFALNNQEVDNLVTCQNLVNRKIFTVDEVKSFTEPERKFLEDGYFYKSSKASILEQLEEFREEQKRFQIGSAAS